MNGIFAMNGPMNGLMNGPMNGNFQLPKWEDTRLVTMTLVFPYRTGPERVAYCMTLANGVDEAFQRAREHYGDFVTLNAWGCRRLPLDSALLGGGFFLRGERDAEHEYSLKNIRQLKGIYKPRRSRGKLSRLV